MNACVRAVVRTALHHGMEVYGIMRGYSGMIKGEFVKLDSSSVSNILQRGGTMLKSARSPEFHTWTGRQQAYMQLVNKGIEGLVAIGGNGTFTGAMLFEEEFGLPTVGAPGTIDNDLYGTDFTIGYDTAVNTALESIDKIRDTADSHDRAFFVEVMGRDSGYIALPCAVGGGAEIVLVPEHEQSIESIIDLLQAGRRRQKSSFLVVVAEGEVEGHAAMVAQQVRQAIPELDVRVTVMGHIQRGGAPSAADRLLASQLGVAAVEGLRAGQRNVMAGIVNHGLVYTPFHDCIHRKKTLNPSLLDLVDLLAV